MLPWLDLYETAFPPQERVLVSRILAAWTVRTGGTPRQHLLAASDASGALAGLAWYDAPRPDLASLWYLAVPADAAARGLARGSIGCARAAWSGQRAAAGFRGRGAGAGAEVPLRGEAERRIKFYRRLGAQQLTGVRYLQFVGRHQPPMPMLIMLSRALASALRMPTRSPPAVG